VTDLDDRVSRPARLLVAVALVLLLGVGLVGFDAWPLTAWRLFSLSRGNTQTHWVLDTLDAAGQAQPISLERLPLPYRTAEWPLADLPHQSEARREDVCLALLVAVVDVRPDTRALHIVKDRQAQVRRGGDWVVAHDREPFYECAAEDLP
jgi:hypothetical protein